MRPSMATTQKHQFKRQLDDFVSTAKPSAHTDISGAVLQAAEFLNETQAKEKYILIFSDLEEDLVRGHIRDFTMPLVQTKSYSAVDRRIAPMPAAQFGDGKMAIANNWHVSCSCY